MRRFFFPLFSFIVISCSSGSGAIDTDGDGIPDQNDRCPNTPVGAKTDEYGCVMVDVDYFELVYGGEQNEPWEKEEAVGDMDQTGHLVQSFSVGASSLVDCDLCKENEIHRVLALTPDALKRQYPESRWPNLSPVNGDQLILFYADGRNNPSEGVGGGPPDGSYSNRTELSDNLTQGRYAQGDKRYYSLSFWPPKEIWSQKTKFSTIISQWKQYRNPPNFELRLSQNGDYKISVRSNALSIEHQTIGTATADQWNHLKYYVKNSSGNDGEIKIWLNGNLVYAHRGKTLAKTGIEGYLKFGMYTELRDLRVLLFDAVKISNGLNGKKLETWARDQN